MPKKEDEEEMEIKNQNFSTNVLFDLSKHSRFKRIFSNNNKNDSTAAIINRQSRAISTTQIFRHIGIKSIAKSHTVQVKTEKYGTLQSYKIKQKLGEGTYAIVYKGKSLINKQNVALKFLKMDNNEGAPCTAIREISILRNLNHSNIILLHDIIQEKKKLVMVLEYTKYDLEKMLTRCHDTLRMRDRKIISFQILRGLEYIHSKQILHRDLKPSNILVNLYGEVKIADFGLSRSNSIPYLLLSAVVVTLWYRSPDVLLGSVNYSYDIDMWSFGCILGEIHLNKPIFPGKDEIDQLEHIFACFGKIPSNILTLYQNYDDISLLKKTHLKTSSMNQKLSNLKPNIYNLIKKLLDYRKDKRPTAKEAMTFHYFEKLTQQVLHLKNNDSILKGAKVTYKTDLFVPIN